MADIESRSFRKITEIPFVAPTDRIIAASRVRGLTDRNGHTNGSRLVREQRLVFDGGPSVVDKIKP